MIAPRIAIATNNGDIGGGEVMLLNIAEALRSLNIDVLVIGPQEPGELIAAAAERGFETVELAARNRPTYMARLTAWRSRNLAIPLWCNGLVPSTATAGMGPRLAHLHLVPTRRQRFLLPAARLGARSTLVPSEALSGQIQGTTVLENWTVDLDYRPRALRNDGPVRLGFIGRHVRDKGLDVLLHALADHELRSGRGVSLVLAGDARFGTEDDRMAMAMAARPVEHLIDRIGWVERDEFFDRIDLAVFPSVARETFGLVATEAMASGLPFVISDNEALREVAGPAHPWISRSGDAGDLTEVLVNAVGALTTGQVEERVRDARARWERNYSPAAGRRRVATLLSGLALQDQEVHS